jgi:hypothetical protein
MVCDWKGRKLVIPHEGKEVYLQGIIVPPQQELQEILVTQYCKWSKGNETWSNLSRYLIKMHSRNHHQRFRQFWMSLAMCFRLLHLYLSPGSMITQYHSCPMLRQ